MLAMMYISITILLLVWGLLKHWLWLTCLSYFGFLLLMCAILPLPQGDKHVSVVPTQVVFRFDEYRYLQLTGLSCRGKLYYIDEQKQVYNELAVHSAEVLTEPFAHTVGDYIFLPYSDYSGVRYSQDGGRTFKTIDIANVFTRPKREQVNNIVVVNNQLFIDSSRGIYRSPLAFGTHYGVEILSDENLTKWNLDVNYHGARWREKSQTIPTIPSDYRGWYHWQCDFDKEQYAIIYNRYQPLIDVQITLRQVLGLSQQENKL